MVLVDTSIWIDHFSRVNSQLQALLALNQVLVHPYIIGELACGNLKPRDEILNMLSMLPTPRVASDHEALYFVEANQFYGQGIGYMDAHLLASVALERTATLWTTLWTRDKRLQGLAQRIQLDFDPASFQS
jgi:predicted nucleic acid-binding protein